MATLATRSWQVMLVAGFALTAGYFAFPSGGLAQSVFYNAISLVFVCAIVVGIRLNRPADKATWWLFAIGSLCSIVADTVSTVYIGLDVEMPFPSVADIIYLAAYPFLFLAVARFGRGTGTYRLRERRLDAAIVAVGALVLLWQPLVEAYASDSTVSLLGRVTLIAYPVMDLALLYIVVSAMLFGGRRGPVDLLVGLSIAVMVAGDFAYDLLELHGAYSDGNLVDSTWLLNYLLLAVAALHPSMAGVGTGRVVSTPRLWWLVMVVVASFMPPGFLFFGNVLDLQVNVAALAGMALVMAAFGTIRMGWMFQNLRDRARQLRARTAALQEALVERDSLEDDLRHQAFHDPLTGLANRALLQERIEQALARSSREKGMIALIVCDLDGFKNVNDSLGHHRGDALLVAAANRLASVVRPGDTVARLGGDEFAALLDGVREPEIASAVAARIVSVLHEPTDIGGDSIAISASVGVMLGGAANSVEELISDADAAMYEAKNRGKNRFLVFESSMRSRAVERLRFTTAFAGAIERSEFRLDYQPSFSLTDGRLQGFEALVRWQHPTLGLVAPPRFIPLAEETGFIHQLGRWILENACAAAASWPATLDGSPTIAVNISACQLNEPDFLASVREALDNSGLPGDRLVLEVTESTLITDRTQATEVLRQLRLMGVRVAIDDFGVGYSSLDRLRRLPVDFVKIDKSFVDQISSDDGKGRRLIEAILRLAKDLDLTTVAEGIEVASQRDALSDMGCHNGQGYLLSHPLDGNAAGALAARSVTGRRRRPGTSATARRDRPAATTTR